MKNLLGICLGALICFTILVVWAVVLEKQYEQICEYCAACNFTCNITGEGFRGCCADLKEFCGNFTSEGVHSVYVGLKNGSFSISPFFGGLILGLVLGFMLSEKKKEEEEDVTEKIYVLEDKCPHCSRKINVVIVPRSDGVLAGISKEEVNEDG